jgi:hypothetical protein
MHSGYFTFGTKTEFRFYLICININTKFAVVYPMNKNQSYDTKFSIQCIDNLKQNYPVRSIRADGGTRFGEAFDKFLKDNDIKVFYSSWKFINKNIVDRFIRTIGDAVGIDSSLILNTEIVQQIVKLYNQTPHLAFLNRFTPLEVQNDPEIEAWYIRRQQLQLHKIQRLQLKEFGKYKLGNILMIHVPEKKTEERFKIRKRDFDELGVFQGYIHGNVMVFRLRNKRITNIPIYYTRYIAESMDKLPQDFQDFFHFTNSLDINF